MTLERQHWWEDEAAYEYVIEHRFVDDATGPGRWIEDSHPHDHDSLTHLMWDVDRLNSQSWSRMEWRVSRRPKHPIPPWQPIWGMTDEQRETRKRYNETHRKQYDEARPEVR